MPQKDDFLTRLQEQLRSTLEQVHALSASGQPDAALHALHEAQRRTLGLDSELLHRISSADLLTLLGPTGFPDVEKCLLCAEGLSAEYQLLAAQRDTDPALAYKALDLYLSALSLEPGFVSHYSARLGALTHALAFDLPVDTTRQLVEVYTQGGLFAEAENWLYRWGERDPAARLYAESFYQDLLKLDDAALAQGGLPRDEVEEGLAALAREEAP